MPIDPKPFDAFKKHKVGKFKVGDKVRIVQHGWYDDEEDKDNDIQSFVDANALNTVGRITKIRIGTRFFPYQIDTVKRLFLAEQHLELLEDPQIHAHYESLKAQVEADLNES